jgi:chromosome segregation ATPase
MKQVITKEEVSKAIAQLKEQGKRPTLAAIHARLNNRGSMSTLVRLKSELEASTIPATDSAEGLKSFREIWALAVAEGRGAQEQLIDELRGNVNSMAAENERLEERLVAGEQQLDELNRAKLLIESELRDYRTRVQVEIDAARATAAEATANASDALARLSERQADHRKQMAALQSERDDAVRKAHEMEMKLVRALALLEVADAAPCGSVWLNHNS